MDMAMEGERTAMAGTPRAPWHSGSEEEKRAAGSVV